MGGHVILNREEIRVVDPDLHSAIAVLLLHIFSTAETVYDNPAEEEGYEPDYRVTWPSGDPDAVVIQALSEVPGELAFSVMCSQGKFKRFGRRFDIEEDEQVEVALAAVVDWAREHEAVLGDGP
ncbi:hypothetical protein HYH03_009406 [Edaphochlamys debaryana]|uniref:Uncharacterized protein n=1 Tax=Edaphochlamys debaryana TaxID=47281 RepID=A0A835XYU1_9CHLO|nr:hypothetical protein HYH03_009406 [Edaphochlamys debaryana]|eukprot:KAG2492465.1 hypothetical protein HYH03_009406 [Edaphochlamys debaryana]